MIDYKEFFKGKKVTQMGLGLLGRGVGDAAFLAECLSADQAGGADLIVTDMKSAEELAPSVEKLKQYPNIKFKLGGHDMADFKDRDFVLKAAGVPLDSIYIAEAKKNNVEVEMDASLFCKLAPEGVITIGVTGTRGKSTVTHLISNILNAAGKNNFLAGNVRDIATLPLLKEVKSGDYVVLELDSWQLQGFGDAKISPHVSVFTAFMKDHMNYYVSNSSQYFEDKSNIYKFQKREDVLVAGEGVAEIIMGKPHGDGEVVVASKDDVPSDWRPIIIGEHNMLNIACAMHVAEALGIEIAKIKEAVESFAGVEGRLQFVKEIRGIKIYNDNNASTPEATVAALTAFETRKNIILIMGGTDKNLDMSGLINTIPKYCKATVLFKETGTDKIKQDIFKIEGIQAFEEDGLENCVKKAMSVAGQNDIVLFSPAFSSFGKWFKNEYDRNDQFMEIIKDLK